MAISLSSLRQSGTVKPPVMVLFGVKGVGKTTLAAGAPDPVFICVEDGLGMLDVPSWKITTFAELMDAIGALYTEDHDRKTLVIDSLDWLEPLMWTEACRRHGWDSIESPGYGKGYVAAAAVWREYLDGIAALRDEKGMTIIQIAHELIKRFDNPETDPYDRYKIKLHDRAADLVQEHAEIVAFLNYRVAVKAADVGFNKKINRAVGAAQRVLYLEERPAFHAKNRFGLPSSIDLPSTPEAWKSPGAIWAAFAQHLPGTNGVSDRG
jgi:hypothetical protein